MTEDLDKVGSSYWNPIDLEFWLLIMGIFSKPYHIGGGVTHEIGI